MQELEAAAAAAAAAASPIPAATPPATPPSAYKPRLSFLEAMQTEEQDDDDVLTVAARLKALHERTARVRDEAANVDERVEWARDTLRRAGVAEPEVVAYPQPQAARTRPSVSILSEPDSDDEREEEEDEREEEGVEEGGEAGQGEGTAAVAVAAAGGDTTAATESADTAAADTAAADTATAATAPTGTLPSDILPDDVVRAEAVLKRSATLRAELHALTMLTKETAELQQAMEGDVVIPEGMTLQAAETNADEALRVVQNAMNILSTTDTDTAREKARRRLRKARIRLRAAERVVKILAGPTPEPRDGDGYSGAYPPVNLEWPDRSVEPGRESVHSVLDPAVVAERRRELIEAIVAARQTKEVYLERNADIQTSLAEMLHKKQKEAKRHAPMRQAESAARYQAIMDALHELEDREAEHKTRYAEQVRRTLGETLPGESEGSEHTPLFYACLSLQRQMSPSPPFASPLSASPRLSLSLFVCVLPYCSQIPLLFHLPVFSIQISLLPSLFLFYSTLSLSYLPCVHPLLHSHLFPPSFSIPPPLSIYQIAQLRELQEQRKAEVAKADKAFHKQRRALALQCISRQSGMRLRPDQFTAMDEQLMAHEARLAEQRRRHSRISATLQQTETTSQVSISRSETHTH